MPLETTNDVQSFFGFLEAVIRRGQFERSPEDLVQEWRSQREAEELRESSRAVQDALSDMEQGDSGRPLRDVAAAMRAVGTAQW